MYYDTIYKFRNYRKESNYIKKIIDLKKKDEIIDVGCGTGNHIIHFAKSCLKIKGIDKSKDMIAIAKKKINHLKLQKKITFKICDLSKIKINQKFDKAIILFHTFSYINKDIDIKNFFKNISKSLKKDGKLVLDYWYKPAVKRFGLKKKTKIINNNGIKVIRYTLPLKTKNKNLYNIEFNVKSFKKKKKIDDFKEIHKMRSFDLEEIIRFSKKYFEAVKHLKYFSNHKPNNNDWTAVALLKKK